MARSRAGWVGAAAVACAGLSGCAGFWDEVTSRDFSVKAMVSPPDPMSVLRTSTDGDARAKAMRRLEEPRARGGSEAEQEEVMVLLTRAAVSDPQPLCRMTAIQTLGRFKDPRAVQTLVTAYQAADQMTPDLTFVVQTQALGALGQTRHPEAVEFLAKVARQPVKDDLSERERGHARDVRLAAVRSLGNFANSEAAAVAARQLAQTDRDVAVRDRAREAFASITGSEMPTAIPTSNPGPVQAVGHTQP
jgi:hypothetical protein